MTQSIDPTTANIEECRRWLAEQPCLRCKGRKFYHGVFEPMACNPCERTGLAFPWASDECLSCASGNDLHTPETDCNGSGRVPKAVGLEELFDRADQLGILADILSEIATLPWPRPFKLTVLRGIVRSLMP